tara:strand:- start:310 stop:438 length:129 start_codon:yes stop_codon:yes gene_type:complete
MKNIKYPLTLVTPKKDEMCKYSEWVPCECPKCKNLNNKKMKK